MMRCTLAIAALLTAGSVSLALADPATPTAAAPQSSTAQSSAARTALASASAAATDAHPATRAKASTPAASDDALEEKSLLAQGYKVSMYHGEKMYCRREIPTGSKLPVRHCLSMETARAMAKEAKEFAEGIQRNTSGCITNGRGGAVCN